MDSQQFEKAQIDELGARRGELEEVAVHRPSFEHFHGIFQIDKLIAVLIDRSDVDNE
jgi:hypothetical protein